MHVFDRHTHQLTQTVATLKLHIYFSKFKKKNEHLLFIQREKTREVFCLMALSITKVIYIHTYIHTYHSISNTNILTIWKMGVVLKLWYMICWDWLNSNAIPSAKASDWTFFPLFLHYAPRVENPVQWGCSALSPSPAMKIWTLGRPMRLN